LEEGRVAREELLLLLREKYEVSGFHLGSSSKNTISLQAFHYKNKKKMETQVSTNNIQ
jgi:hypothetical protein